MENIGVILAGVIIFVIVAVILFVYTDVGKAAGEQLNTNVDIQVYCQKWHDAGCKKEYYDTNDAFKTVCKNKYGQNEDVAYQRCKEACLCEG